jgi:hypothetical protein
MSGAYENERRHSAKHIVECEVYWLGPDLTCNVRVRPQEAPDRRLWPGFVWLAPQ